MSDIPEEIMAKARAVVADVVEAVEPRPPGYIDDIRQGKHDGLLREEITTTARALLAEGNAAEKRGYERGRAEGLEEAARATQGLGRSFRQNAFAIRDRHGECHVSTVDFARADACDQLESAILALKDKA